MSFINKNGFSTGVLMLLYATSLALALFYGWLFASVWPSYFQAANQASNWIYWPKGLLATVMLLAVGAMSLGFGMLARFYGRDLSKRGMLEL